MTRQPRTATLATLLACALTALAAARGDDSLKILYRAPEEAGEKARVDPADRPGVTDDVTLTVLAPDHVGLTVSDQPSLYWYQSRASKGRLEVAINVADPRTDEDFEPVLEAKLPADETGGIRKLDLAEHKVALKPNVKYQWVVALVTDENNRSLDRVASGVVQRVEPDEQLADGAEKLSPVQRAIRFARAGIWYDALAALSAAVDANPDAPAAATARRLRSDLFQQVALAAAAKYDRSIAEAN